MARLIDADKIENKFVCWLGEISKDITNDIYQGSESDGIAACLEEIRGTSTIDPENLFFTVGKRADYLEKLYTKIQAVTRLTPERLLELFMEGYTLQAPDPRKELEEMQRIAWMDLPGQNGGQERWGD